MHFQAETIPAWVTNWDEFIVMQHAASGDSGGSIDNQSIH
jgi:hypothetical protein